MMDFILSQGLHKTPSPTVTCVKDYKEYCRHHMEPKAWTYFSDAAMEQITLKRNINAFSNILIKPKHFVAVGNPFMKRHIHLAKGMVSFPVGIAPTAHQRWVTPEGELASVHAGNKIGVPYIASIHGNTSLEDIAKAEPTAFFWQQTYLFKDNCLNKDILRRAELAGVKAIVLTIDKTVEGCFWGREEVPYPSTLGFANFGTSSDVRKVLEHASFNVFATTCYIAVM